MFNKSKKLFPILISIFTLFSMAPTIKANDDLNEPSKIEFSFDIEDIDFTKTGTQTYTIENEYGAFTVTVEDLPKPRYTEYWSQGSFNKHLSVSGETKVENSSIMARMEADFRGEILPYVAYIYSVSNGKYYGTITTPVGEPRYAIEVPKATGDLDAFAAYYQEYNINGIGLHEMSMRLFLSYTGKATINMMGTEW